LIKRADERKINGEKKILVKNKKNKAKRLITTKLRLITQLENY
jgi:hypothetical protein